jgi:hypothetical protein
MSVLCAAPTLIVFFCVTVITLLCPANSLFRPFSGLLDLLYGWSSWHEPLDSHYLRSPCSTLTLLPHFPPLGTAVHTPG